MSKANKKADVTPIKSGDIQKSSASRMLSPFEEFDRMFDNFFGRGWMRPSMLGRMSELGKAFEGRVPNVDVIDRENEIIVKAELPGVDKDNIEVSLGENTVTIKGSTRKEEKEEKGDYYRCEISSGSFSRTVGLPASVDSANSKASFRDGVLELTLPKREKAVRKSIKVE
ncbi:MAG: Hsp20/alpha crystallin family protein [Gammaproteobacteria bacterium]|nr:MAG: Hsp20/alpha crystallin family protein [Gammaproteobacteria bacterium]